MDYKQIKKAADDITAAFLREGVTLNMLYIGEVNEAGTWQGMQHFDALLVNNKTHKAATIPFYVGFIPNVWKEPGAIMFGVLKDIEVLESGDGPDEFAEKTNRTELSYNKLDDLINITKLRRDSLRGFFGDEVFAELIGYCKEKSNE